VVEGLPTFVQVEKLLAEHAGQHDDWIEGRRYLGLDVLARSRIDPMTPPALTA
jgi:hypothetical protein